MMEVIYLYKTSKSTAKVTDLNYIAMYICNYYVKVWLMVIHM